MKIPLKSVYDSVQPQRDLSKIDPEVEALAILRAAEEIAIDTYHMVRGLYGGIWQLQFERGPDTELLLGDLTEVGERLRAIHDRLAQEIIRRRGVLKETLNEEAPDATLTSGYK